MNTSFKGHLKQLTLISLIVGVCCAALAFFFSDFVNEKGFFHESEPGMFVCNNGLDPEPPPLDVRLTKTASLTFAAVLSTALVYIAIMSLYHLVMVLIREELPEDEDASPSAVDGHV